MKFTIPVIVFAFLATLSSCKKDELTLPADVTFSFGMLSVYADGTEVVRGYEENSASNSFTIDKGFLAIEAIEFDGRRDEGKDVFFISDLGNQILADLDSESTNIDVRFDIPQGVYNRIDITLHLCSVKNASLILEGDVSWGNQNSVPIRFEYCYADQVRVRAKPRSGNSIVLQKDKLSKARVELDAQFMFRFINPSILSEATLVKIEGKDVLLINSKNNIDIFNQIANRLGNSFSVVFE